MKATDRLVPASFHLLSLYSLGLLCFSHTDQVLLLWKHQTSCHTGVLIYAASISKHYPTPVPRSFLHTHTFGFRKLSPFFSFQTPVQWLSLIPMTPSTLTSSGLSSPLEPLFTFPPLFDCLPPHPSLPCH